jgi:hypothetical protein
MLLLPLQSAGQGCTYLHRLGWVQLRRAHIRSREVGCGLDAAVDAVQHHQPHRRGACSGRQEESTVRPSSMPWSCAKE